MRSPISPDLGPALKDQYALFYKVFYLIWMRPCTDHDFRLLLFTPRILRGTIHIPRTRSVKSPTRPLWPADGDYPLSCECSPWCLSLLAISHDDWDCWEPLFNENLQVSKYHIPFFLFTGLLANTSRERLRRSPTKSEHYGAHQHTLGRNNHQ